MKNWSGSLCLPEASLFSYTCNTERLLQYITSDCTLSIVNSAFFLKTHTYIKLSFKLEQVLADESLEVITWFSNILEGEGKVLSSCEQPLKFKLFFIR